MLQKRKKIQLFWEGARPFKKQRTILSSGRSSVFFPFFLTSTKSESFCPARPNVWGLTLRVAGFRSRVDIALFLFSPTWPVIPLGGGKSGRVAYLRNSKSQNWTMRENIILRLRGSRFAGGFCLRMSRVFVERNSLENCSSVTSVAFQQFYFS